MAQEPVPHRKRVRHYDEPAHAHELTFSCYKRLPLLEDPERCLELSRSIDRAMTGQRFELIAFVFMPDHVWVGTDKGLFAWSREVKAWSRIAVGAEINRFGPEALRQQTPDGSIPEPPEVAPAVHVVA